MPFCPKCGALVTEEQNKCLECGTTLIAKPKGEGFFRFVLVGIMSLLIPILGFVYFLTQRISKPKSAIFALVLSIIATILWILFILLIIYIGWGILEGIFGGSEAAILFT